MSLLPDSLFVYLKERSTSKKIVDLFFVITLFTWTSLAYLVATNYTAIKHMISPPEVDVRSLIRLDQSINQELERAMNSFSSDRVALARFHNTVKDIEGNHFIFETRTNESLQPGVSSAMGLRQTVLVSMITPWAKEFAANRCVFTTDLKPEDIFFAFYRQIGVKSDIKCPVNNISGNLIGFVYIEFTTRNIPAGELKSLEAQVRLTAEKIGAILSVGATN